MPGWDDIYRELRAAPSAHDQVRRRHLASLADYTDRNVIYYYSAWLEKSQLAQQGVTGFELSDNDKNGFMATIHKMNRAKGLDLLLHTPGGEMAATESIVDYLREMFDGNIRAIIPHLAMSGGTMIALSCKEILMGRHSSLGPIDPQIFGMPAHGIVDEFNRARSEIVVNPTTIPLWQPIIGKYPPTLIGECENAIKWSREMVSKWLATGMFAGEDNSARESKTEKVLEELGNLALTKSHARHIGAARASEIGLNVTFLEGDQELQERVLSVHHAFVQTASDSNAIKIIENHLGVAHVMAAQVAVQFQPPGPLKQALQQKL